MVKTHHKSYAMQVAKAACMALLLFIAISCRVTRHVPDDREVVSRVHIMVDGEPSGSNSLKMAVQQKPYHRTFGFLPVATWIWHNDTTSRFHRWRNKIGTEPVLYDEEKTLSTERALLRTLNAQGYLYARVSHEVRSRNRKASVAYIIDRGLPKTLSTVKCLVEDPSLYSLITSNESESSLKNGVLLDRDALEDERTRLTSLLRNHGYWDFNKDDISFIADTLQGRPEVDLTVLVSGMHEPFTIRTVHFITDFNILSKDNSGDGNSTLRTIADGYDLLSSGDKCYLRDNTLIDNCFIVPGSLYTETAVKETYSSYSRLHLLKYTNIRLEPVGNNMLDAYIDMSPQNPKSVQFELDGTNTSGDLGFAAALSYQHRNLLRGSETYSLSLKGGYESLTGNVAGLVNNNYSEYAVENMLDIPKFIFPFLSDEHKKNMRATTSVKATFSYQTRPEYTRFISNLGYGYKWQKSPRKRHTFDIIDLSYVYLPKRSASFIEIIGQAGPISYSSYSSHLIMAMGYNLWLTNNKSMSQSHNTARDIWSLRLNAEIAGNVLWAISRIANLKKDENGNYNVFGLPFEQYARLDMDWSYSQYLTDRSRLAYHVAGGIAVPYGNSKTVPFEKRYYSGGANSVRGWSVRTLGPGTYRNTKSGSSRLDYFNQCGDVRFDAAIELRSKLFWKIEFATFLDAGNVWTLKDYKSQPGGKITSDFYKQIALATGLGMRMITDFVVLRLDMGIKTYDPYLSGSDAWAIRHPLDKDNRAIHFAVGYPF